MKEIERLAEGMEKIFATGYFSGDYNQDIYIKKSMPDDSKREKFFLNIYTTIDNELVHQGTIYFFLDQEQKESYFIGIKIKEQFRNLNIASLLLSSWIDLCLNNDYELKINQNQKKPFLLYLLKTYGFEVEDISLYNTRSDVISICRSSDIKDIGKYLLFKDSKHEQLFTNTHIFKNDNYKITHSLEGMIYLDNIILPIQSRKRSYVTYELLNKELAELKAETTIKNHKR